MNHLHLLDTILYNGLQPWLAENHPDEKFAAMLSEIKPVEPDFTMKYEMNFRRPFNFKTKYYQKLITREMNLYFNRVIAFIAADDNHQVKKYWINDTLNKKLQTRLKEVGKLIKEQHRDFNTFFIRLQEKYLGLQERDFIATIRRMGLIASRKAVILTSLRIMESGDYSQRQECSDADFERVLSMIRVLIQHSSHVFSQLPEPSRLIMPKKRKEQFLERLPEKFMRHDYLDLAISLSHPQRTAERYIALFCEKGLVRRDQQGNYTNFTLLE